MTASMQIARITENQQVTLDDYDLLAKAPRHAMDVLVKHAIEGGMGYAGGSITKTAPAKVQVSTPLYFVRDGGIYSREENQGYIEVDLYQLMPGSGNKRWFAIVLQGDEVQDASEERDFLVNAATEQVEARPTSTVLWRRAQVATIAGAAAPDPVKPVVTLPNLLLGYVEADSTQILGVEQNLNDRLVTLRVVNERLKGTEAWQAVMDPIIGGLRADVARLSALAPGIDRKMFSVAMEQIARLNYKVGIGAGATFNRADYFLNLDQIDPSFGSPTDRALVQEGVRMADDVSATKELELDNPTDTRIMTDPETGVTLPRWTPFKLLSSWRKDAEAALSSSGSYAVNYVKRTVARSRIRWGDIYTVCSNWLYYGIGIDPTRQIFEYAGDTWVALDTDPWYRENHQHIRIQKLFVDTYEEVYWDRIVTPASYTGNVAAQSFLMPRAGWLVGVNLGFSRLDTGGDVRVLVTKVLPNGTPDPKNVICETTVVHNAGLVNPTLKLFPDVSRIKLPPTYLKGGERYAVMLITAGNHWIALSEGNKYSQGGYFQSTDGVWFQGDISRDFCFEIEVAQFAAPRLEIPLKDWDNVSGGIGALDLLLEKITPEPTSITFRVKPNLPAPGNTWYELDQVPAGQAHPLAGLPTFMKVVMVLQGTTDVMPGIRMASSRVTKRRSKTTFTNYSKVQTTEANVSSVEVYVDLENYVPDNVVAQLNHDFDCKLLLPPYTAETAAGTSTWETRQDGSTRFKFVFSGLPANTKNFRTKLTGLTSDPTKPFHVASMAWIAYP